MSQNNVVVRNIAKVLCGKGQFYFLTLQKNYVWYERSPTKQHWVGRNNRSRTHGVKKQSHMK